MTSDTENTESQSADKEDQNPEDDEVLVMNFDVDGDGEEEVIMPVPLSNIKQEKMDEEESTSDKSKPGLTVKNEPQEQNSEQHDSAADGLAGVQIHEVMSVVDNSQKLGISKQPAEPSTNSGPELIECKECHYKTTDQNHFKQHLAECHLNDVPDMGQFLEVEHHDNDVNEQNDPDLPQFPAELRPFELEELTSVQNQQIVFGCPVKDCTYTTIKEAFLEKHLKMKSKKDKAHKKKLKRYLKKKEADDPDYFKPDKDEVKVKQSGPGRPTLTKLLKCPKCTFTTYYKSVYKSHLNSNRDVEKCTNQVAEQPKPAKKYPCTKCSYVAAQMQHLKSHLMTHEGGETLEKCVYCSFVSTKYQLTRHMRECVKSQQGDYKCLWCDYVAKDPTYLKNHVVQHENGEPVVKCNYCEWRSTKRMVGQHHRQVHAKDHFKKIRNTGVNTKLHFTSAHRYKCNQCSFAAKREYTMNLHVFKIHKQQKQPVFQCPYCSIRYIRRLLSQHINRDHVDIVEDQRDKEENEYVCPKCDHRERCRELFQKHLMDNEMGCISLSDTAETLTSAGFHDLKAKKNNSNERFPCDRCSFVATNQQAIYKHNFLHAANEPILDCPDCDFKSTKAQLNKHRTQEHGYHWTKEEEKKRVERQEKRRKLREERRAQGEEVSSSSDSEDSETEGLVKNELQLDDNLIVSEKIDAQGQPYKYYQCGLCSYGYHSISNLHTHFYQHARGDKIFDCPFCDFKSTKKSVSWHKSKAHKGLMAIPFDEKQIFYCEKCKFGTRSLKVLQNHVEINKHLDMCADGLQNFAENLERLTGEEGGTGEVLRNELVPGETSKNGVENEEAGGFGAHFLMSQESSGSSGAARGVQGGGMIQEEPSTRINLQDFQKAIGLTERIIGHEATKRGFDVVKVTNTELVDGRKTFQCTLCSFITNGYQNLINHFSLHKQGHKMKQCPHCDFKSTQHALALHIKKKHPMFQINPERSSMRFFCSKCDYRTTVLANLQNHIERNKNRTFCTEGIKKKAYKKSLKAPKVREKGDYSCHRCGYKTEYISMLEQHIIKNRGREMCWRLQHVSSNRRKRTIAELRKGSAKIIECLRCDFRTDSYRKLFEHVVINKRYPDCLTPSAYTVAIREKRLKEIEEEELKVKLEGKNVEESAENAEESAEKPAADEDVENADDVESREENRDKNASSTNTESSCQMIEKSSDDQTTCDTVKEVTEIERGNESLQETEEIDKHGSNSDSNEINTVNEDDGIDTSEDRNAEDIKHGSNNSIKESNTDEKNSETDISHYKPADISNLDEEMDTNISESVPEKDKNSFVHLDEQMNAEESESNSKKDNQDGEKSDKSTSNDSEEMDCLILSPPKNGPNEERTETQTIIKPAVIKSEKTEPSNEESKSKANIKTECYENALGDKLWACRFCSYSTYQSSSLLQHSLAHGKNEKILNCSECDFKSTKYALIKHKVRAHNILDNRGLDKEETEKEKKLLKCKFCDYTNYCPKLLFSHSSTHDLGQPTLKCTFCDYKSTRYPLFLHRRDVHGIASKWSKEVKPKKVRYDDDIMSTSLKRIIDDNTEQTDLDTIKTILATSEAAENDDEENMPRRLRDRRSKVTYKEPDENDLGDVVMPASNQNGGDDAVSSSSDSSDDDSETDNDNDNDENDNSDNRHDNDNDNDANDVDDHDENLPVVDDYEGPPVLLREDGVSSPTTNENTNDSEYAPSIDSLSQASTDDDKKLFDPKEIKCTKCDFVAKKHAMRSHMEAHKYKLTLKCPFCTYRYLDDYMVFYDHKKAVHPEKIRQYNRTGKYSSFTPVKIEPKTEPNVKRRSGLDKMPNLPPVKSEREAKPSKANLDQVLLKKFSIDTDCSVDLSDWRVPDGCNGTVKVGYADDDLIEPAILTGKLAKRIKCGKCAYVATSQDDLESHATIHNFKIQTTPQFVAKKKTTVSQTIRKSTPCARKKTAVPQKVSTPVLQNRKRRKSSSDDDIVLEDDNEIEEITPKKRAMKFPDPVMPPTKIIEDSQSININEVKIYKYNIQVNGKNISVNIYQCNQCDYETNKFYQLLSHQRVHKDVKDAANRSVDSGVPSSRSSMSESSFKHEVKPEGDFDSDGSDLEHLLDYIDSNVKPQNMPIKSGGTAPVKKKGTKTEDTVITLNSDSESESGSSKKSATVKAKSEPSLPFVCQECPFSTDKRCSFSNHVRKHPNHPKITHLECSCGFKEPGISTGEMKNHQDRSGCGGEIVVIYDRILKRDNETPKRGPGRPPKRARSPDIEESEMKKPKDIKKEKVDEIQVLKCRTCTFKTLNKSRYDQHIAVGCPNQKPAPSSSSSSRKSSGASSTVDKSKDAEISVIQVMNCSNCTFKTLNKTKFEEHKNRCKPSRNSSPVVTNKKRVETPPAVVVEDVQEVAVLNCKYCNFKTLNQTKYNQHVDNCKAKRPETKTAEPVEKLFKCPACFYKTKVKISLDKHFEQCHTECSDDE